MGRCRVGTVEVVAFIVIGVVLAFAAVAITVWMDVFPSDARAAERYRQLMDAMPESDAGKAYRRRMEALDEQAAENAEIEERYRQLREAHPEAMEQARRLMYPLDE
jgi:thioredoxin-like negative regulator of GroEL